MIKERGFSINLPKVLNVTRGIKKKILKKKLNFEEKSNLKAQEIDKVSFPYFTAFGFSL